MGESRKISDRYKRGVAIASKNRHTLHTFLRSFLVANCVAFQHRLDSRACIRKKPSMKRTNWNTRDHISGIILGAPMAWNVLCSKLNLSEVSCKGYNQARFL
jgi:hypothetical protein